MEEIKNPTNCADNSPDTGPEQSSGTGPDKCERFVAYVLARCAEDKGFAARLRRADNPDTEDQSYGFLVGFGINIENDFERLPHTLVGAALARSRRTADGTASLGKALRSCFEDAEQGDLRLRRLLACDTQGELCRILRPVLALIADRGVSPLCYSRLLRELVYFNRNPQRPKLQWAQEYYSGGAQDATEDKA